MKALSVKQPWANLIACGRKTIETRTWPTSYRGRIAIVSSKRPAIEPAGCAVCLATVADCRPMRRSDEAAACCEVYHGAYAWLVEDVEPVEPVPLRGALGVFSIGMEPGDFEPASAVTLAIYAGSGAERGQIALF